jgi:fructose/tagatose bisphosphate aldolase
MIPTTTNPKFYIGPMSKNVVDAIIEFYNETNNQIGLIPSRRQIEWNGGYVNNWTVEQFSKYTKMKLILKRDHAGPGQGYNDDDGYKSLEEDCKFFNKIHIDPWKKYPKYKDGLQWTINMINFCYNLNSSITYEIGTEEAIRRFKPEELDKLVSDLSTQLKENVFNQIKHLVIQSGTSLKENINTGEYDKDRLLKMVNVAKHWGLMSKEHNGDYIPSELIKEKMSLGLDSINIAPEFGQIETKVYLNKLKDYPKLFNLFYGICYNSDRWKKWVNGDFNPLIQKEELINICGHYVLSDINFLRIKNNFPNIDLEIKSKIKQKLNELFE